MLTERITFAVAVNDRGVLERNLLASSCFQKTHPHQILIQEGFRSAATAYNDAIEKAENELIVFMHQDMLLPSAWLTQVNQSLQALSETDSDWGVAGCWGVTAEGKYCGHVYSSGLGVLGEAFQKPMKVQTLDEIVLMVKKSSGLFFDSTLPHFHFYGTDICMRAASRGQNSYAISAFCIHNTSQLIDLPEEFYGCYDHVKKVWLDQLPIQTSCIRISRFDAEVYRRRLEGIILPALGRKKIGMSRTFDPQEILRRLEQEAVLHDVRSASPECH